MKMDLDEELEKKNPLFEKMKNKVFCRKRF